MKPLKLEFKGVNSFSERTVIDFEALIRGGIFGIFGDTGSGKSTILDCINFALFGDVERSKEKTDIINYNSDRAEVTFVFNIINDGKRKIYTIERTLKKDKNGTHKAALYENDGEKEVCIADKASQVERKIVEILGVEAEDFRKCIALPQGEFSQFVKSAPSARLALIERLFNLSRYGDRLKEKLARRQNENESVYQNLSGRLQTFSSVSEEILKERKLELQAERLKLEKLQKEQASVNGEYERIKDLNAKLNELKEIEKSLQILYGEKAETERLRAGLSILADCREAVKISEEMQKNLQETAALKHDILNLENEIGAHISLVQALKAKIESGNFEDKISECIALAAKYSSCEGKAEKLEEILSALDAKREEYKILDGERKNLLSLEKSAQEDLTNCEKSLQAAKIGADLEKFLDVELKGAVLKNEFVQNLDYFSNFNGGIKVYKEDSPLYNYVSGEISKKIKEYKQRVLDLKDFHAEDLNARLEDLRKNQQNADICQKSLNDATARLQRVKADLTVKNAATEAALKEGKALRERVEEIRGELARAFGADCKSYALAVEQNAQKLQALKAEREKLVKEADGAQTRLQSFISSKEKLNGLLEFSQTAYVNLEKKLNEFILEKGLGDLEKCKSHALQFENYPNAEQTVADFDKKYARLTERYSELEKTQGIFTADDESLQAKECEKSSIYAGVTQISGNIAVFESEIKTLEENLAEKLQILKEFRAAESQRNLLAQLKEVTKGNKFLEFIANEYLTDISRLASVTLLKLTGGRYFLTYKDNNFFAGDNFNCGNLRGVNTLSGGETFLVSLSLALALSQTICSKSAKSIEFFFLDEGFGTLDGALVETVMSALEKLKSSSFTIGVISHVEELKHRISNKITVNKATETHGSTVTVSC